MNDILSKSELITDQPEPTIRTILELAQAYIVSYACWKVYIKHSYQDIVLSWLKLQIPCGTSNPRQTLRKCYSYGKQGIPGHDRKGKDIFITMCENHWRIIQQYIE